MKLIMKRYYDVALELWSKATGDEKEMIEDYILHRFGENWKLNPPIIKA